METGTISTTTTSPSTNGIPLLSRTHSHSQSAMVLTHQPLNRRAVLTVQQQGILSQFAKELDQLKLTSKQRKFCDEACMLRYLRARDWDLKKSLKMIKDSLVWREKYGPDRISAESLEHEASTGKLFRRGFDKMGRPVIYMHPVANTSKDYAAGVRLLVYLIERAIESMPENVEQLIWFIDFKGMTRQNLTPVGVAKETLDILSNQYPERLGACFFVDTPSVFTLFWNTIKPFINPVTRAKVHIVNGSEAEKAKTLGKFFDMTQMEKKYGGEVNWTYQHNIYWKNEMELDGMRLKRESNTPSELGTSPISLQ